MLQNCKSCVNLQKCWPICTNTGKSVSMQNIIINILICRLQLNIDRDKAAINLLQIFRPGMIRLISHVKQSSKMSNVDMDQLLSDMKAVTIELLLRDYKIGDRGRATPYLFDPYQGFLTKWIKWMLGRNKKFYAHHELIDPLDTSTHDTWETDHDAPQMPYSSQMYNTCMWDSIMQGGDTLRYDPYNNEENETLNLTKEVMAIIDDGVTLNSNEYRVIKFCLANGNEANNARHIDGLHIYMARLMNVSRPRVTRLYKRARQKILNKYKGAAHD